MLYAKDRRTGKEVAAAEVSESTRHRAYICPTCGAKVHYKSSIGTSLFPVFAHNKLVARPDCDLYQPGVGTVATAVLPPVAVNVEDLPGEIGLCLEDEGSLWNLYLRIPEIPNARFDALRSGSIEIEAGEAKYSLSLLNLRPGIGSARQVVKPSLTPYKVSPKGIWPPGLSQAPWRCTARGLNPRGNVFRMRRGEWVRLREGTAIELGEKLRVVALVNSAQPPDCSTSTGGIVLHAGNYWKLWRIEIPFETTPRLDAWAETLGFALREAAWHISLASAPQGFNATDQTPIFASGEILIAKLTNPRKSGKTLAALQTSDTGNSLSTVTSQCERTFLAFSVNSSGKNELSTGDDARSSITFHTAAKPDLDELRKLLRNVPVLSMEIRGQIVQSWQQPFEIQPSANTEEPPEIKVLTDVEDFYLGLAWRCPDGDNLEEGLSVAAALGRLKEFWGKNVDAQISCGPLGFIRLRFREAPSYAPALPDQRILQWASFASLSDNQVNASSWMYRRSATRNPAIKSLTNSLRGGRWTPLAACKMKRSKY